MDKMKNAEEIVFAEGDLPAGAKIKGDVAADTETTGLSLLRDRLCVVQIRGEDGKIFVVKVAPPYDCPRLKSLLADPARGHIFHFARFDLAMIKKWLGIGVPGVFCTKIASRLSRTNTEKHSLKALVAELFGTELDKAEQSSDWAGELDESQIGYAAGDVRYLHEIRDILSARLAREGRLELARKCFDFLQTRVELDLLGWGDDDLFAH
jgi:ribonuclease D